MFTESKGHLLVISHQLMLRYGWVCVPLDRVGLMGNPSDGFNGKTIAMSISNFWAEITLVESETLVPHAHMHAHTRRHAQCTRMHARAHTDRDREAHTHTFQ